LVLRRPYPVLSLLVLMLAVAACTSPVASAPAASLPPAPATATPANTACSNPLYPVIKGAEWTYAMSGISTGTFTHSIIAVRADGFTDQDVFESGVSRTGQWSCNAGALTALSPAESLSAMVQTQGVTAEYQTVSSSGFTLPALLTPGTTWDRKFTVEGTQSFAGQDVQGKGDVSYSCTAADSEIVAVPAGSFDAVRVGCQINGPITVAMAGFEIPIEFASAATMWYATDVGMIKTENEISGIGHSTIELTSYAIP